MYLFFNRAGTFYRVIFSFNGVMEIFSGFFVERDFSFIACFYPNRRWNDSNGVFVTPAGVERLKLYSDRTDGCLCRDLQIIPSHTRITCVHVAS